MHFEINSSFSTVLGYRKSVEPKKKKTFSGKQACLSEAKSWVTGLKIGISLSRKLDGAASNGT